MNILAIKRTNALYGGGIYEKYLYDFLAKTNNIEETILVKNNKSKLKYFAIFNFFIKLFTVSLSKKYDYTIRGLDTSFFLSSNTKNIVIAHHYDTTYSNIFAKTIQFLALKSLILYKSRVHTLVVVSKYWFEYFEKLGFENIKLIYNPFDIDTYQVTDNDIDKFYDKYNLKDKPILYIGNAQRKKGADLVYESIKDDAYHIVTSGKKQLDIDTINLDLSFEEYIVLLHISSVVILLSQFKEGWNRVAHEALLCKTPVIGSGFGGMGELLSESKQIISNNPTQIKEEIKTILNNYEQFVDSGYVFASKFDLNLFHSKVKELI